MTDFSWNKSIQEMHCKPEEPQADDAERPVEPVVMRRPTDIKDKNGNMIYFGDKVRFVDKVEWYWREYWADVLVGNKTREQAIKEINERPYEERVVESVQDYEWLLSDEIQTYWEVVS